MSWYRQIKTFYTFSINMFFFIIWGVVSSIFLGNRLDYRLYLVSLALAFLIQFMTSKRARISLIMLIAVPTAGLLTFMVSKGIYFILNSMFIIFIIYMTSTMEYEDVNYDAYKARARNGLVFLLFLGALLPLIDIDLSKSILKFYVMYLISNIIVMREARSYYYKVRTKRSFIINVIISVAILAISADVIFARLLVLIKYVMRIFGILISAVIDFIGLLLAKPLVMCISKLQTLMTKGMELIKVPEKSPVDFESAVDKVPFEETVSFMWMYNLLRIAMAASILAAVFIMISRAAVRHRNKASIFEEHREKITREKSKKEGFISKLIKSLAKPSDIRGQILNIYRKFEEKTYGKGIFKRHMTAKQLENVTRTCIEKPEGLSSLTSIYNEAKFSKHETSDEKLRIMKEEFGKVKKQL
jgi:hypothetical protein